MIVTSFSMPSLDRLTARSDDLATLRALKSAGRFSCWEIDDGRKLHVKMNRIRHAGFITLRNTRAMAGGKTYNAGVGVEKPLLSGARVVIVDPLDVWWGLRLNPDGQKPSRFKLPIFGGAHSDLPLTEQAGALIGETVATMAESCIISLGGLPTKAAERRFMLAFLTALYRHQKGEPLHLVLDEADLWAPQVIFDKEGDAQKLQGMMQQIVRRGLMHGFIFGAAAMICAFFTWCAWEVGGARLNSSGGNVRWFRVTGLVLLAFTIILARAA